MSVVLAQCAVQQARRSAIFLEIGADLEATARFDFPVKQGKYRENRRSDPKFSIFGANYPRKINSLQMNSRGKITGNIFRHNREFKSANREFCTL